MEIKVYTKDGKEKGVVTLPETVFGLPWNADLMHQAVVTEQANARQGSAHTKDRSEVRGGGRKPWRQKGLGRARHGSRRSPIWKGGGITFGPRNERDYSQKLNKKMRMKALATALSRKFKDGELIFVDELGIASPKTKDAKGILVKLAGAGFPKLIKRKNAAVVAIPSRDQNVEKSFRNIGSTLVAEVRNLSPLSVLSAKYLIFVNPAESLSVLEKRSNALKAKSVGKNSK